MDRHKPFRLGVLGSGKGSNLVALAEAGHIEQLLLGGDTTVAAARSSTGGGPGMPWLLRVLRPRLVRALGEEATETVLVHNPARALSVDWPAG